MPYHYTSCKLNERAKTMELLIVTMIVIIVPIAYNEFKAKWGF